MSERPVESVPVLIVGGSLVGLSAAVYLGRFGTKHLLVERHAATSTHPRGRGNNLRTMETFRAAGVEKEIREAAVTLSGNDGVLQVDTLSGGRWRWIIQNISAGKPVSEISPSGWCLCSQNDLEPVLLASAKGAGSDIRFGNELVSFVQDKDKVQAEILDRATGETYTVDAQYLIAADGPRSPVRHSLGIERSGAGELFHNVSVTFRSKGLKDFTGGRRFVVCYVTGPGEGALLPVDNEEQWVFHIPWSPEREPLDSFTSERCATHIRAAAGVDDLDVEITGMAPWHAADFVAESYGHGRVFLAGDSAHEMPPTGAFGSNTGIQDAHNLAWKLTAVLRGWAGPGLLDTYQAERRPVALATSARASLQAAEEQHPGYKPATGRNNDAADLLTVGLCYRYLDGAVAGADPATLVIPQQFELGGAPGSRAPHTWVTHAGSRISLLDLFETSFVLLAGARGSGWLEAARKAAADLGVPISAYTAGPGSDCDLITSEHEDWAGLHGVSEEGAVLVRPDGFVAWRSPTAPSEPAQALTDALMQILRRH